MTTFLRFELAQLAWQLEELEGLVERDGLHALVGRQLREAWLVVVVGCAYLHHWAVPAYLHEDWLARLGVGAQLALAGLVLGAGVYGLLHHRLEVVVEVLHHVRPLLLALGYLVELLLYLGREVVVHDAWEVFHEEVVDHDAYVGWQQLALVAARHLGAGGLGDGVALERVDGVVPLFALVVAFVYVFALLYGAYCGGVG